MARKPSPGKCVHCLEYFEKLTWDHVFPESWYPVSSHKDIAKWKIPSCLKCNKEYGKIEEDLLLRLGLCIDPENINSSGIPQKAIRALQGKYGKNFKDTNIREAKKRKILNEVLYGDNIPKIGLFPNFEEIPGLKYSERVCVPIKANSIEKLAEKIIRGINYLNDGLFIERPYSIKTYVLKDHDAEHIVSTLKSFGTEYACGPGIKVMRAVSHEDTFYFLYSIEIWEQLKMYGAITKD